MVFWLIVFTMASCSHKRHFIEPDVTIIEPLKATNEVTDLSSFIEGLELIPVSEDPVPFAGVTKMLTGKVFFVLSGGMVFSVSRDGQYVRKIGNVGRGPGEYIMLKDIALNMTESELWCLDIFNDILKYDVETGEFIEKVDVGQEIGSARAVIPMTNDNFALYIPNPP